MGKRAEEFASAVWEAARKAARNYCRGVLGTADLDDVAMEATLKALKRKKTFDETKASLETWVSRIVRSVATDIARSRIREGIVYIGDIQEWLEEGEEDD